MTTLLCILLFGAPMSAPAAAPASAPAPAQVADPVDAAAELTGANLDAFLALGPQGVLAATVFEPVLRGRRFIGWRVVAFRAGGPLEGTRAVGPGDIITRLNGEPLERPEQFMKAWETLRRADTVSLELVRADAPLTLRWHVRR